MPDEPLTPAAVETKLRQLVTSLTQAQQQLAKARDNEVAALHEFRVARAEAVLSPEAPKVERGGATTAERDAFVDKRVEDHRFAAEAATALREDAQDRLRVVRDQCSVVQTLARSVQQAYSLAGMS